MFNKGNFTLLIFLCLIFIGFGDSFLPQPLSSASLNTRTAINNFVVGMFPSWQPRTNPHQRTEEALKGTEKK